MHQILIDTRPTLESLAVEACNCASVGTGYQHEPPRNLGRRGAGYSKVVATGMAGRILKPTSAGWEKKDRCDYYSIFIDKSHYRR